MKRTAERLGFTVVEVLVALALLTLGAVAIVSSVISSMQALSGPVDPDSLLRWAEDEVFELSLEELEDGGSITLPDERVVDFEAEVDDGPLPDLMRCVVRVELDGEESFFTRYFFEPGAMDSGESEYLRRRLAPLLR